MLSLKCLIITAVCLPVFFQGLVYILKHYTSLNGALPLFATDTLTLDDIPKLHGKTIAITGANAGLGFSTAKHVAGKGAKTILLCRSSKKCLDAARDIRKVHPTADVNTHDLDLSALESVQTSANELLKKYDGLDALILNAGVMCPPHTLTQDGMELQFQVNHVGHFYFALKLLPLLENAASAEGSAATITVVSSMAHEQAPSGGIPFDLEIMNGAEVYSPMEYYAQSKLANILFSNELSKRLLLNGEESSSSGRYSQDARQSIYVNALHPGVVQSELGRHFLKAVGYYAPQFVVRILKQMLDGIAWTSDVAALTQIYTAVSPQVVNNDYRGAYFHPLGNLFKANHPFITDANQRHLWSFTETILTERGFDDFIYFE